MASSARCAKPRASGAAIVAAHPYAVGDATPLRPTRRFAQQLDVFSGLVDRWELFNRRETFSWVVEHGLSAIASGDFHHRRHLTSWKTALRCEHDESAIVDFLRSHQRAYMFPFGADRIAELQQAA